MRTAGPPGQVETAVKNLSTIQALIIVSEIGFAFAVSVVIGVFGGIYLDSLLHTSPVFAIIGAILGAGGGIYGAVELARTGLAKNDKSD